MGAKPGPKTKKEHSPEAKCPGRNLATPCRHGKNSVGQPAAAGLGITVKVAAQLEANTGRPPRCFECSSGPG